MGTDSMYMGTTIALYTHLFKQISQDMYLLHGDRLSRRTARKLLNVSGLQRIDQEIRGELQVNRCSAFDIQKKTGCTRHPKHPVGAKVKATAYLDIGHSVLDIGYSGFLILSVLQGRKNWNSFPDNVTVVCICF